jgi:hypothetical protein
MPYYEILKNVTYEYTPEVVTTFANKTIEIGSKSIDLCSSAINYMTPDIVKNVYSGTVEIAKNTQYTTGNTSELVNHVNYILGKGIPLSVASYGVHGVAKGFATYKLVKKFIPCKTALITTTIGIAADAYTTFSTAYLGGKYTSVSITIGLGCRTFIRDMLKSSVPNLIF